MKNHKIINIILITLLLLIISFLLQICFGAYSISYEKIISSIFDDNILINSTFMLRQLLGDTLSNFLGIQTYDSLLLNTESLIIWNIRIPRFIVGICVGINLACSGVIFQTLTKNEMASPYILGISQGSGLSILLILIVFPFLYPFIQFLAMLGGIIAFLLIYIIAWNHGTSPIRLILAGVIIGSICSACQTLLFFFVDDLSIIQNAMSWTVGSLVNVSWEQVRMILPCSIIMCILSLKCSSPLDLMLLGDNNAKSLGISVEKWRFILASIGIFGASTSVAVVGLIGFVGLISPHISRILVGSSHKKLFIGSTFIGAALLSISDTLSRIILNPTQIPVGLIMSIIGGIFFLFLMKKNRTFHRL